MWSSVTLGFSPDDCVPETVHALMSRFLELRRLADEDLQPLAQHCSMLLWVLATMAHPAATQELVDPMCSHFARLTHSSTAKQRPTAQEVCNVLWSLTTLDHTPQAEDLLDRFCLYVTSLLYSEDTKAHPSTQSISNLAWSLSAMKHRPPKDVGLAWLESFLAMCRESGDKAPVQAISLLLFAYADLRLNVNIMQVEVMLEHLLQAHVFVVELQAYCNVAWSLAVMGILDTNMFDSFLR